MTNDNQRKLIPTPDDFSVEWENEDEAQQTWHRDTHHRPDPTPPLEADFWAKPQEKRQIRRLEGLVELRNHRQADGQSLVGE